MNIVEGKAYKVTCEGKCGTGARFHVVVRFGVQDSTCDCPAGQHGLICKHRIAVARMGTQTIGSPSASPLLGWS